MVELVREFTASSGLRVEIDEDLDPGGVDILGLLSDGILFEVVVEGTPQVVDVDWNIFEMEGQKTRIETRFGTTSVPYVVLERNDNFAFLLMTSGLLCRRLVPKQARMEGKSQPTQEPKTGRSYCEWVSLPQTEGVLLLPRFAPPY